jgi:hypothetical protein
LERVNDFGDQQNLKGAGHKRTFVRPNNIQWIFVSGQVQLSMLQKVRIIKTARNTHRRGANEQTMSVTPGTWRMEPTDSGGSGHVSDSIRIGAMPNSGYRCYVQAISHPDFCSSLNQEKETQYEFCI